MAATQVALSVDARRSTGRSAVAVAIIGAALTLGLGARIYALQSVGRSAAAIAMSADMDMRDMGKYWSFPFLQSSGLVGLLFAHVAALLGLWQADRKAAGEIPKSWVIPLHRHVSLYVVGSVLVHMLATALDAMGDSWRTVLVPGTWAKQGWPEAVTGYNTGIAAAYLLILVAPSFYLRNRLGAYRWRLLHRLVLVFYVLSIWHAMILGLDVGYYAWLRPLIWLLQIPILMLLMKRLYRPMTNALANEGLVGALARIACAGLFALSAAASAALLFVVLTGRSGFIPTV
jgi:hypothetical protein